MAACNQTDIPVLNIQEDPCIQGSLITSCIFYGLAIDYLGAQSSSSFFDVLGLIVAKLEAGNIDATNLEEDNRAQALLIEDLQNSIAESLVTLSEVQVLLEQCCPEPTTTTSTTTIAPTTTTTIAPTTTNPVTYSFTVKVLTEGERPCDGPYTTVYTATPYLAGGTFVYSDSGLTTPVTDGLVIWVAQADYYTGSSIYNNGQVYGFNRVVNDCITTSTTTIAPTTTTTSTTTIAPTTTTTSTIAPTTTTTQALFPVEVYVQGGSSNNNLCPEGSTGSSTQYMYCTTPTLQAGSILYQNGQIITGSGFWYKQVGYNTVWYPMYSNGLLYEGCINSGTLTGKITNDSNTPCNGDNIDISFTIPTGSALGLSNSTVIAADGFSFFSAGFTSQQVVRILQTGTNVWFDYLVLNDIVAVSQDSGAYTPYTCQSTTTTIAPTTTTTVAPTTTTTTVAVPGSYVFGTTGSEPFGIVVDTAGNIYTSNAVGNNVTKVTPSGVSTILGTTGQRPFGITIDTAGNVYTANYDQSNVTKITPSGVSTILGTTGSSPVGIVIDLLGNIYTANAVGNNVTKITPSGVSTILGTTGANPRGIAIDADGNIYTANYASANITKITPSGVSTNFPTNGGQAQGITVDSAGNIYVANTGTSNVSKITPDGTTTILGTTGTAPQWIAVDTSGNVYTSNANVDNVTKITPSGVSTILGTTGSFPQGIATDVAGNVYTANRLSNNVTKIVQAPTTTTTVPVGLTCPEGFPNRTTGNGTMTLSNGVTLTTTYTGPELLSGNFNPPFTMCGNSFKGNNGAGGTMYLNYTGGAFTLTLTFSQPQSHIAFGISGMGIYNQQGVTESYTFTTNGGSTQITELNGCGNFQVQGFNTLVGSNNDGTASDGSGAIQVTSSGLFTEVTITGNNPGSLNGVGIDLYLCSNLILQ